MPTAVSSEARVRETLVVDASAIVSLLIDPGAAGRSIAMRLSDATLIAPALLPFEVANVLRRRRNGGLLSSAEAGLALEGFAEIPIGLWPWETVAARAWKLGDNLSSYDASYVSLAEQTDAVLVTRDKRLAATPGVRCVVEVF